MRRKLFALATLLCCAVVAQAQPPADLPPPPYQIPPIVRETLPNGLRVAVLETKRVPLVTIALIVRAGALAVPPELAGIDEAVVRLISEGTEKKGRKQRDAQASRLGGIVNVDSQRDGVVVTGTALAKNARPILALMHETLLKPTFEEETLVGYLLNLERQRELKRINVSAVAKEEFDKALFPGHPYGQTDATAGSVRRMTLDAVKAFHANNYRPDGALLAIVGDVRPAEAIAQAKAIFGSWQKSGRKFTKPADPPLKPFNTVYLLHRPNSVQSNVLIGNVILNVPRQEEPALQVANAIFGEKTDSRIFNTVRQKYGYAYFVGSRLDFGTAAHELDVRMECRTAVTTKAIQEIFKEVTSLHETPVSSAELESAKNYVAGKFLLAQESQIALANALLTSELDGYPPDYLATFPEKVRAVTAADVQRAAKKYLLPGRAVIVVVGDADKLSEGLSAVGTVQRKD